MKRKTFMQSIGLGVFGSLVAPEAVAANKPQLPEMVGKVLKIRLHIQPYHKQIRTYYKDGTYLDKVIEHSPGRLGRGFGPTIHDPRADVYGGCCIFPKFNLSKESYASAEEHEDSSIKAAVAAHGEDEELSSIVFTFADYPDDTAMGCIKGHHRIELI